MRIRAYILRLSVKVPFPRSQFLPPCDGVLRLVGGRSLPTPTTSARNRSRRMLPWWGRDERFSSVYRVLLCPI